MRKTTIVVLFVFITSFAHATLNYSEPEFDLTVDVSESTLDAGDSFEVMPPPQLPQPDWLEPADANIVKYNFDDDPDAPSVFIELFHER